MSAPLLTIIIPAYNAAASVGRIVSSIVAQEFRDFELIVVDDGSTDNTINVLRGLKKNDPRIIIRSQKNGGPSSARNTGLEKARGQYVMFFDADDDIDPQMLKKMVSEAQTHKSDLVVCGWRIDLQTQNDLIKNYKQVSPPSQHIEGSQAVIKPYVLRSIGRSGQLYNLWNKLFRRDIIQKAGLRFREDLRFGEDLVFTFHYLRHASRLQLIPTPLYHYVSGSSSSLFGASALAPEYRRANDQELRAYAGEPRSAELDDLLGWVRWRWLLSYYLIVARSSHAGSKKLQLIRAAVDDNLSLANQPRHIGIKYYLIEVVLSVIRHSSHVTLFTAHLVNFAKQLVIDIKSRAKNT